MIFSKIWLINGLLAIALVISAVEVWDVWHETPAVFSRANSDSAEKQTRPGKKIAHKQLNGEARYADIVDKNLFSPDRAPAPPEPVKVEPEKEEIEVEAEVKISGEKVTLYGVIVLDGYKKALTNDPSDRAVEFRWISEGDKIGNLAVREILEDSILLTDKEKSYRILLYDPEKVPQSAAKSSAKTSADVQPQVISTGTSSRSAVNNPSAPEASEKQNAKVSASSDSEDKYEIIETPFGTIKRKRH